MSEFSSLKNTILYNIGRLLFPGVKHWHGASRDSWFEHLAITAGTPEWMEAVFDEIYQKAGA